MSLPTFTELLTTYMRRIGVTFAELAHKAGRIKIRGEAMRRFENQVAIVTGAANGIGFASAQRLASEGAALVVADYQPLGACAKISWLIFA